MKQITRKRALELAMECIEDALHKTYNKAHKPSPISDELRQKYVLEYTELAATLNFIETLARQKELL
jgi:hypothetical protein